MFSKMVLDGSRNQFRQLPLCREEYMQQSTHHTTHYAENESMNIQIFGTKKSADTRKAERFFKERRIKYQFVNMKEKELSKGEFRSVMQAVGGLEKMIDPDCRDKDLLALVTYLAEDQKADKVFENQILLKQPVVRNGKKATVGYQPDVWKNWE